MDIGVSTLGASFLAGVLTTLNPCVLPILPVVVGTAMSKHAGGLVALVLGLATAFTSVGVLFASSGWAIGLDQDSLRYGAAVLMVIVGLLLVSHPLQEWFAQRMSSFSSGGNRLIEKLKPEGPAGQFGVGALLGLVWAPCIGPTLGAAIVLAGRGESLAPVTVVMGISSLGAVLPLIGIGLVSQQRFHKVRGGLQGAARVGKQFLGAGLLAVSLLVLTGLDKTVERWLLNVSPGWLLELTSRF